MSIRNRERVLYDIDVLVMEPPLPLSHKFRNTPIDVTDDEAETTVSVLSVAVDGFDRPGGSGAFCLRCVVGSVAADAACAFDG